MNQIESERMLKRIPDYEKQSLKVARSIHRKVLEGGPSARSFVDFLHGTWLGHPLHAVLTDFTVGVLFVAGIFDLVSAGTRGKWIENAADRLTELGALSAVPTALAGVADYSTIARRATATGATHGILNATVLLLNLASIRHRRKGNRVMGLFLSSIGLGLLTVSAWLGGELVYRYGVGINKAPRPQEPADWTPVLDEQSLADRRPIRVEAQNQDILLYRVDGQIYAISAICSHEAGPLEEGEFHEHHVQCPWHQSVFDLRDGSVVHGPAVYAQPGFETRVRDGKIEVRKAQELSGLESQIAV